MTFTVLHIKFECRLFVSMFVEVMPLLELKVLEIHFSAVFSYMLWHIELKFCIWICFTVLQIEFECHQFASIFVGVMPLLELRILKIQFFALFSYMLWHIELKFCIWLCFTVLQIKSECHQFKSTLMGVMPLLELRILEIHIFLVFSSPEPKAQVHYCDHGLCIIHPSVVRTSVVFLSHFRLLLWNHWTEFNETWQEARSQRPLPSLCFSGRSEKQDGRPGLWFAEIFSTSSLKPLNRIQQKLIGSKISMSSTKFVFFGPIGKTRWPPWPLIGWYIFDFFSETAKQNSRKLDRKQDLNVFYQVCVFRANRKKQDGHPGLWSAETFSTSLKPLNGIFQWKLTESKISTSSTKFVFFGPIGKTRWLPWPLICWDIFDFFSATAERNSTKLDRKQDLNVLYQVCVFRANLKNKMAAPSSDWQRQFRLLLWNCWTDFNETWQKTRSQRPLPSFC